MISEFKAPRYNKRLMEKGTNVPIPSTTFVQTDANTFKELVQRLTGPHEALRAGDASQSPAALPPSSGIGGVRKPTFKLHERRQGSRSKLTVLRPNYSLQAAELGFSVSPGLTSPSPTSYTSPLISPSCSLSNLLISEKESPSSAFDLNEEEEDKAIRERRFYLHPSPRSGNAKLELLPLFPLTSPK